MNSFKNNGESGMTPQQLRNKMNSPKTFTSRNALMNHGWSGDTYTDKHGRTWVMNPDGLSIQLVD
jgi:hypothetical protein